jgi:hypothetical protein
MEQIQVRTQGFRELCSLHDSRQGTGHWILDRHENAPNFLHGLLPMR